MTFRLWIGLSVVDWYRPQTALVSIASAMISAGHSELARLDHKLDVRSMVVETNVCRLPGLVCRGV